MFSFDNFLFDNMPVQRKFVYDRFCDPEFAYWPNDTWRIRSPKRKNVQSRNLYNHLINGLIDEILDPRYDSDVEMEIEYQPKQKQLKNQPTKNQELNQHQSAKNVKNQELNQKQPITENRPSEVALPNNQLVKPTEINLHLSNYKPEEISINVKDGRLTIKGKREHKDDSSYSCQSFERTFILPENCDQEKINCQMNANGLVKLNIPHKVQQTIEQPKEIKIIHEQSNRKDENQVKSGEIKITREDEISNRPADDEPIVQDLIEE